MKVAAKSRLENLPIFVCLALAAIGCGDSSSDLPSAATSAAGASAAPPADSPAISASAGASGEQAVHAAGAAAPMTAPRAAAAGRAGDLEPASSPVVADAGPPDAAPDSSAEPAADSGGTSTTSPPGPLTVYIAGDSTVSDYPDTPAPDDQAGWGQMLHTFARDDARIDNRAIGGRTARRFIDEDRLEEIWQTIQPGDYLLVQFGTNDGNRNASYELDGQTIPYYLDPDTDFKTYLLQYIMGARSRGATLVLVTPPPRNSAYCTGGNGTGAHAQAMRELGAAEGVIVSDLNQRAVQYLQAICPEPEPPDFFLERDNGSADGTHFQERGALKLAELVAAGLREAGVPWLRDEP